MKLQRMGILCCLLAASLLPVIPAHAAEEPPSAWAAEMVETAVEAGLVPETLQSDYDHPITRAEFCALAASVYRAWNKAGQTGREPATPFVNFPDCADPDVVLCASLEIVVGTADGSFEPDKPISRQDAASMLRRLASVRKDYDDAPAMPHVFDDGADLRSWARRSVYWVYQNGIMQGTGDNTFTPGGSYTREQSIVTMLRLYDETYAVLPQPEEESPYTLVYDAMGVGCTTMHLEDREGNRLFTDFLDSEGYFRQINFFGGWLGFVWNDYGSEALYYPETGTTLEGYILDGFDEKAGVGWAWEVNKTRDRMVIHADGTTGGMYLPATNWYNGRVIVWTAPTTLTCIDQDENVLWSCTSPVDLETFSTIAKLGDRLVLQQDQGYSILENGIWTQYTENLRPCLLRWSNAYIFGDNGWYTLRDRGGKILAGPYANVLDEVGQDLYCRWVSDTRYEYFRCLPGGTPQVLYTVDVINGHPGTLATDGGGVYALRTGWHTIACFDRFGDPLGTIETDILLDNDADISFEGGCVRVDRAPYTAGETAQSALYLPTGEKVE